MNLKICNKCLRKPDDFIKVQVANGYLFVGISERIKDFYGECDIFSTEELNSKEVDKILSIGENKYCPYKFEHEVTE
jgi:hypothetical protein